MNFSWKKLFTILLTVSLMLTGCSTKNEPLETTFAFTEEPVALLTNSEQIPETTVAVEPTEPKIKLVDVDGILYAEALGTPVLGKEKVRELYQAGDLDAASEAITNVGDAIYYLLEAGDDSWIFYDLLAGDYEVINWLDFCFPDHAYRLVYIKHQDMYYAFDPFNLSSNWICDPLNDCACNADFNLLCDKLVKAYPYEDTSLVSLETPGDLTRFFSGYPAELVKPVLGQEQVEALYKAKNEEAAVEAITTVGDAIYYIIAADMHFTEPGKQPRPAINLARKLLAGDFEAVDCLGSEFNDNGGLDLLLVQHEGIYYVFDLFNPYGDWLFRPSNSCSDSDLMKLIEKVSAVYPCEGTRWLNFWITGDVAQRDYGMPNEREPYFDLVDAQMLQRLNEIRKNQLANGGQVDVLTKFGVYDDALVTPVLGREKVEKLYKKADLAAAADTITNITDAFYYLQAAQAENTAYSKIAESNALIAKLIGSDYDSVGYIDFTFTDNYYRVLTVEYNGIYHVFDPFRATNSWILRSENDCYAGSDLTDLSEKLLETFPFKGSELIHTKIIEDFLRPHGTLEFEYAGTTLPVALGQPQLTDEQIDALIQETDNEIIARTITTLPDAVNFYRRKNLSFYDEKNNNTIGKLNYVQSAWQVLKSSEGQCVSTSNLTHYLLEGDYDEVGYVYVRSPGDGHIMSYILQDGMYYLINPVQYTNDGDAPVTSVQNIDAGIVPWLAGYPNVVGCSEDFQEIADSLVQFMKLEDDKFVTLVHRATSPGDFVTGEGGKCYAKGMDVVPYYGTKNITYLEAGYEWDTQTRIDY